jgi:hypothetical protein
MSQRVGSYPAYRLAECPNSEERDRPNDPLFMDGFARPDYVLADQ